MVPPHPALVVIVVVLLSTVGGEPEEARISYEGAQLLRVDVDTDEDLEAIVILAENEDVNIWGHAANSSAADIMVNSDKLEKVKEYLDLKNITYEVIIDDLENAIRSENPQLSEEEMDGLAGKVGHRMTWQSYHRMSDIHDYLEYLARTYPDVCSIETIGSSVEGKPLKVLKISSDNQGSSAIWVDGGIHAREWISPATVTYFINELVVNRNAQSEALRNMNWYVHPLVNPDGYEHTHRVDRLWRKNRNKAAGRCVGVDLNRNFAHKWGGAGASHSPCKEIYAGTRGFSEPETAALSNFVLSRASNIKAYITFHSYGQYILYPWGYERSYPPDHKEIDRVARKMAQAIYKTGGSSYTVGSSATTLYPAAGGSDDWAKGIANIKYAYTIELRDRGYHGFVLPANYIVPTAREAIAALNVIAEEVKST